MSKTNFQEISSIMKRVNGDVNSTASVPSVATFDSSTIEAVHSDEIDDIITAVPPWLLRWGITVFFVVILSFIGLSALIRYPDIVKTHIKINSFNSPKPVVSKISGKIVKILINESQVVSTDQPLAFLESTADHSQVLILMNDLYVLRDEIVKNRYDKLNLYSKNGRSKLGELQGSYQAFYEKLITFSSSVGNGFLLKKKSYLEKDLVSLNDQKQNLNLQNSLQQRDFTLAEEEFEIHKTLERKHVETKGELRQQESKFLSKKASLIQMEIARITNDNSITGKRKDILELETQIQEEKIKFLQALNSLLSIAEEWKSKYILSAPQAGKVSFAGIFQENTVLNSGQEIFYINPGNGIFFGEMAIPQNNMGKIVVGQEVLIKLKSYPFEQYGMLQGEITFVSDMAYKDSVFLSKVTLSLNNSTKLKKIVLKQGMIGDAEVITQDASVLQRLARNIIRNLNIE